MKFLGSPDQRDKETKPQVIVGPQTQLIGSNQSLATPPTLVESPTSSDTETFES